jgi:hypothetical protein
LEKDLLVGAILRFRYFFISGYSSTNARIPEISLGWVIDISAIVDISVCRFQGVCVDDFGTKLDEEKVSAARSDHEA